MLDDLTQDSLTENLQSEHVQSYCPIRFTLPAQTRQRCDSVVVSGGRCELRVDRRSTTGSVYNALSVHLSRAKLIDIPWRNFPSPEFRTKFQMEVLLFL